jgi:hypothetical protein
MISRRFPSTLLLAAMLSSGCALTPGSGFATLTSAPLVVSFAPGEGRLDATGRLKTDLGYRLTLNTLALTIDKLAFQSTSTKPGSSANSTIFDPAKPPAGYTLCHGGHCHRQDGALVDYADVQAELAGGGTATLQDALTLPVGRSLNLLSLQPADLPMLCAQGCQLDQATWNRAELRFGKLEASGTVVDDTPDQRLGTTGSRSWRLSWTPPALGKALSTTISRKSPAILKPSVTLSVSDQLFDRIDWATLPPQPQPIVLDEQLAVTRQLAENFAQSTLVVRIENP